MLLKTSSIKQDKTICIIGDVMIDHYINGSCSRISPEAPVQVVDVKKEHYTLGGAGNVLKNVFSLGCDCDIISLVGKDANADIFIEQLKPFGLQGEGVFFDDTRPTTMKSRVLVGSHQLLRLDKESVEPINSQFEQQLFRYFKQNVHRYSLVLLSDYNKGLLTPTFLETLLSVCGENKLTTIVDPKGLNFEKYWGADIIKPNKKEASLATNINIVDRETLKSACQKLQEITGCKHIVITMSEDGIALFSNGNLEVIPTQALAIIDVTGAGDTVLASLGVALANGKSIREACDFANHAAAVVINKVGSATVTIEEIESRLLNS